MSITKGWTLQLKLVFFTRWKGEEAEASQDQRLSRAALSAMASLSTCHTAAHVQPTLAFKALVIVS